MSMPDERPIHARRRIAVVLNDLSVSAAHRAAVEQASGLDPAEWQVEIASLERSAGSAPELRLAGHVAVRRPGFAGLAKWLRSYSPDLVHAHLAYATLACRVAAPFAGEPVLVASCHELSDWLERRHEPVRLLARAALHHYRAVFAVSEAVQRAIAGCDAKLASRTRVLRNGTELSAFTAVRGMRAAAREVLGYRPGTFIVGTVARLDARKGLDLLLAAASQALPRVPGLELLLVGDGPERARLTALASELGLYARTRFVGEQSDVRPYLAAFDLFAAPSHSEGSGIALVEALAAGVPVAGSAVGGIPEVLDGGSAGWLVPSTREAWCEAIVRASRSADELGGMAVAGRARAEEYSIGHSHAQLLSCYRAALGEQGAAGLAVAA